MLTRHQVVKTVLSVGTLSKCNVILSVASNSTCERSAGIWAKKCTFSDNFPTCAISLTKNMLNQRHSLTSPCLNPQGCASGLHVHCTLRNGLWWACQLEPFTTLWLLPFSPLSVVVGACTRHYGCCQRCQPWSWGCYSLGQGWWYCLMSTW